MRYQYAKSTDPEVLAAIAANRAGLDGFYAQCEVWAAERGIPAEDVAVGNTFGVWTLRGVRNKPEGRGRWARNARSLTYRPYVSNIKEFEAWRKVRFALAPILGLPDHFEAEDRREGTIMWMTPRPFIHDGTAWLILPQMPTLGVIEEPWTEAKGSEAHAAREAWWEAREKAKTDA